MAEEPYLLPIIIYHKCGVYVLNCALFSGAQWQRNHDAHAFMLACEWDIWIQNYNYLRGEVGIKREL